MKLAAGRLRGSEEAFSLLEVVLVIGIIAILAAVAVPRYGRASMRYRVTSAANRIVSDLAIAREQARTSGSSSTVSFDVASDTYQIASLAALDGAGTYAVNVANDPYQARLISADFGGDADVVFSAYGRPDSGGSVVVQVGDIQKTITLDTEIGRATIQ